MRGDLFESTKVAAYFLWEHTGYNGALDLWYCAEDIACYCEQMGIFDHSRVESIRRLGVYDAAYVHFVKHIAFRIYVYTQQNSEETNWYAAERLLTITEWLDAVGCMAYQYRNENTGSVRSENVRAYYGETGSN